MTRYVASVSFGKDSLAMLLMILEKNLPLDEVIFYDTGMEFQAIYNLRDKIRPMLEARNIAFTELKPSYDFEYRMFEYRVNRGKENEHLGMSWCGGPCRWGTADKLSTIAKHTKDCIEYVGIAADEPERLNKERKGTKLFPLADWNMTEKNCLEYCYSRGYDWNENGIELYKVLDRVSCWCCANKNLKELKNMYFFMPDYWEKLKNLQSRTSRPMKGEGKSVFDLEKRFSSEGLQISMF